MSVLTRDGFRVMRETAEEALRRSGNAVNVLVCAGTGCIAGGSLKVCETLKGSAPAGACRSMWV